MSTVLSGGTIDMTETEKIPVGQDNSRGGGRRWAGLVLGTIKTDGDVEGGAFVVAESAKKKKGGENSGKQ